MNNDPVLHFENLAAYERDIVRDGKAYDINMMVMTGTLEDKHKNVDPAKGIPALRRKFNLVFIFLGGEHDIQVGLEYRLLKKNDLVIVPENMVMRAPIVKGCKGYCIHFKTEFLQPLVTGSLSEQFSFFDMQAEHFLHLSDEESETIQRSFTDIIREYGQFSREKDFLLRNYIHILLLRVRDMYKVQINKINENQSRSHSLANKFKHLVEQNFLQCRTVKEYADMLYISPKHLADSVKGSFGRSPSEMIQEMLLLEAKVLLRSTEMSASQIAHHLNFEDQAHFSHFIKKHTGLTTQELRKKL